MKIDRIFIENFGKLSKFEINLTEGINEIFEDNGFGKTTLSIFIKSMFYGMPPARENIKMDRKKYMPWQGGNFGGYIEYTTSEGKYRLTRFFGKTPEGDTFELLDLKTNQRLEKPKEEVGEILFGVGKETFEITAFFSQNNFQSYANNQITANILGLEKLKFDLANVNLAIEKVKKKESEIKKQKLSKDAILNKKNQLLDLKNKLSNLQSSLDENICEIQNLQNNVELKNKELENINKQFELQKELFKTKENLEKEILCLSNQLNELYLQQDKINNNRQSLIDNKPKKYTKMILVGGGLLLLIPILLSCFSIVKLYISVIIGTIILLVCGIVYYFVDKNNKNKKDYNQQLKIINQENDVLTNKINISRNTLENLQSNLNNYKNITKFNGDNFYNLKEEVIQLTLNLEKCKLKQDNLNIEIDRYIDAIDNLKDEINSFESLEKQNNNKLLLLSKTKEFLSKALQNVSSRFVEPVNSAMDEILENFDMQGRKFVVDTNLDIKQITDKGTKELDFSSQGIKDILSFCLRTYFIGEIFKKEKPVILLDDTFVNLDNKNMEKAKEIVIKLKNQYQIIYCCCHDKCKLKKS